MHGRFYNEATLELTLSPRTPLLIKSGEATGLDPSLPDMQFVRTRCPTGTGDAEEIIYIPGSSLRGVLRSHAERLVRSVNPQQACNPNRKPSDEEKRQEAETRLACLASRVERLDKKSLLELWPLSCFTCRLFGNTGIAARVKVGDLYPNGTLLTEVRQGVAIDRVTGAVAHGPFQMETVTDGEFGADVLTVRNFTLGQLGLLAAALLDLGDGLVPLGHGKSRGLGRVSLSIQQITFRFLKNPEGKVNGIGALADEKTRGDYKLPEPERDSLALSIAALRERGFFVLRVQGDAAKVWIEQLVSFWIEQLSS
jgi:CRISPR-associated protein Csm3